MHDCIFLGLLTSFLGLWATCMHYFGPSVDPAKVKFSRNSAAPSDVQGE